MKLYLLCIWIIACNPMQLLKTKEKMAHGSNTKLGLQDTVTAVCYVILLKKKKKITRLQTQIFF